MRRFRIIIGLAIAACVAFIAFVAFTNEPPEPYVRIHGRLEAPFSRGVCRNHQYIVIETDAHGREREIDEGRFCGIDD